MTRAAIARPRTALALWFLVVAVLASFGLGVADRLREGDYALPGTDSARARELDRRGFGRNEIVPILLQGPQQAVDRQGPRLAGDLRRRWPVLSPWDAGPGAGRLRPSASSRLMLVSLGFHARDRSAVRLAPLESILGRDVRPPVQAHVSGNTVAARSANQVAVDAAEAAQKIAVPVLLLVLLLVFRSPLAAAIPAAVGMATVGASSGGIALLTRVEPVAGPAVSFAAMMGLALGVDYSLLIVSRFREEIYAGSRVTPAEAARTAAATAGRTVMFAGAVLTISMLIALALSPGNVLVSVSSGVVIAVLISMFSAAVAVPAALVVIGRRIDRWRIGAPRVQSPLLTRVARFAMGRPVVFTVVAVAGLLVLASPALSIESAPPDLRQLPGSNGVRRDYEEIRSVVSPGVVTPFEVVVRPPAGASGAGVAGAVARLTRAIAADPGVQAVIAPPRGASREQQAVFVAGAGRDQTLRLFVVPRYFAAATGNMRLHDRLVARVGAFATASGAQAAVGGLAGEFVEYERGTSAYIALLVVCLSVVSFLVLVLMLRAVALPLVAILLNLAVVAATFGALKLLFQGADPPLGGPGFVDVVSIAAIFTIMFALSIDYEVFLLTRMHEAHARGAGATEAVLYGVGRTATVVTGAALSMLAVFLCFATSGFITLRQFGIGLAIAVVLDALVLRLLLLPAAMRLLGGRSWWIPGWLERLMPRLDVEGSGA